MTAPAPSARTTVRRLPARASYERATIEAILDEAVFCHVGFVAEGQPYVIPTIHARVGDRLYLHGSAASRMLGTLAAGVPVSVSATLLDGLVRPLGVPSLAQLPLGRDPRHGGGGHGAGGAARRPRGDRRTRRAGAVARGARSERPGAASDQGALAPHRRGIGEG